MKKFNSIPDASEFDTWFQLILKSRRKNAFQKLKEYDGNRIIHLKKMIGFFYTDLLYGIKQIKKINQEIQTYGTEIKQNYNISELHQFFQQFYLVFILGCKLEYYRVYHLFNPERWKLVKTFTYENHPVQMILVKQSFPEEKKIFDNKLAFFKYCRQNDIPTPEVLAVFEKGKKIDITNRKFSLPKENIFVKHLSGRRGQGIAKYRFYDGKYVDNQNNVFSADDLTTLFRKKSNHNAIIVQKAIQNHKSWQNFTSGALSTCRILTAVLPEDGNIIPLAATLKMAVGNADNDNISTGGLAWPVNIETGILGSGICKSPYKGRFEFEAHPDTDHKLAGTSVPYWNKLAKFTTSLHQSFNTLFVGWDVALTNKGFSVIEGNVEWGASANESPQLHPLLYTQFPEIFDAWMEKFSAGADSEKK